MSFKKLLVFSGFVVAGYFAGRCAGINRCGEAVNENLKKEHGLRIDNIVYEPLKRKLEVVIKKGESDV